MLIPSVGSKCKTHHAVAQLLSLAPQPSLSLNNFQNLLKLISIKSVMPSNHSSSVIPFSFCLQSFPASFFSNELVLCIRWPKYWSFSFSICPSNEYSGLISLRIDWFDLLAVQGTLKSLLQHHSSSILWCSAFFMFHLSHAYMTTGKTIASTMDLCQQGDVYAF